jgi:hypothetical protein
MAAMMIFAEEKQVWICTLESRITQESAEQIIKGERLKRDHKQNTRS